MTKHLHSNESEEVFIKFFTIPRRSSGKLCPAPVFTLNLCCLAKSSAYRALSTISVIVTLLYLSGWLGLKAISTIIVFDTVYTHLAETRQMFI